MKFKDTYRFSPISLKEDLPFEDDLYFYNPEDIPVNEDKFNIFLTKNSIEIDVNWWIEQHRRCIEGYSIENAIEKGGDAIVDGRDAIWNDTDKDKFYYNRNFDIEIIIPPNSCYLADADLMVVDKVLKITGRHYFYLNFWNIKKKIKGQKKKGYGHPNFLDIDFLKFYRIHLQEKFGVDNSEAKSRQLGYTETSSGGIMAYNFLFVPASENVILSGNEDDTTNLFVKTMNGLDRLINTQFYKVIGKRSVNSSEMKIVSKYTMSEIHGYYTATNPQVLSRLSPYWIVYEEVGKWVQGLVKSIDTFVTPSLFAENSRTGFRTYVGTGGEMEKGAEDLRKIHYSTSNTYLRFVNKFEREDSTATKSGWYSSKAWFRIIDEDGNSLFKEGFQSVLDEIDAEKDPVKKYILSTQLALYAGDAFTISSAGFFGEVKINMLNARLTEIRLNPNLQIERHGIFEWINPKNPFDGVNFIDMDNEDDAFVTIIEEALMDNEGIKYSNLYEVGIDSYDQDESQTSSSKGAAVVRKKFLNNDTIYDCDVALILERPKTEQGGASKFFEHCAMAAVYFGMATMTIEHTKIRIFDWLENNGFGHLIALKPVIAFANLAIKSNSSNKYGIDGSMKPHLMADLSDKLTEEYIGKMYIQKQIVALAKYQYNRNYNCDVTVATAHANIGAKESEMMVPGTTKKEKRPIKHSYFKRTVGGGLQRVSF